MVNAGEYTSHMDPMGIFSSSAVRCIDSLYLAASDILLRNVTSGLIRADPWFLGMVSFFRQK